MALVDVYTINIAKSLAGSFGVNDTLTVQYDDATFEFSVEWYDFSAATTFTLTATSAQASWWVPGPGGKVNQIFQFFHDPLICDSTTKVSFARITGGWPWAQAIREDNHNACALAPAVCNLAFFSVPNQVTNATDQTSTDGSFTIQAFSSYSPIQYRIGADFVYNDGNGQSSGTFTGLRAGIYPVYARDTRNCRAFTYVEVKAASLNHVVRYRIGFTDAKETATRRYHRVDILEKGYSGSITTKTAGGSPLVISLRGEGANDSNRFPTFETYEVISSWVATSNGEYDFLFTGEPDKYQLAYYDSTDDVSYTLRWAGRVISDIYDEQYTTPPFEIQVRATDGLSQLSEVDFINNTGQLYSGNIKQIEALAECLKKTGLSLPIVSAINIFPTTHVVTATSDPLDLCYVDTRVYQKVEDNGNRITPDKCNVVIDKILAPYGATLRQFNGKWYIYRKEDITGTGIAVREFTANGVYSSNTTWNPQQEVRAATVANAWHFMSGAMRQLAPAYGKVQINYLMGLQDNIIKNGDFKLKQTYNPLSGLYSTDIDTEGFQLVANGASSGLTYEVQGTDVSLGITNGQGLSYILFDPFTLSSNGTDKMRLTIRYKLRSDFLHLGINTWQKLRIAVQYGSLYLTSKGEWSATANEIVHYESDIAAYKELKLEFDPPASTVSDTFSVKIYSSYFFDYEFTTYADLRNKVTSTLLPGSRTELLLSGTMYWYQLENNTAAESVPNIVRPNDYDAGTNPYQWILKAQVNKTLYEGPTPFSVTWLSKVQLQYLPNQAEDLTTKSVVLTLNSGIPRKFEKELYHGSAVQFYQPGVADLGFGWFGVPASTFAGVINISGAFTRNYIGYLRDSSGAEWRNFKRTGINEAALLENILAAAYAAQLGRPARVLMCGLYTRDANWNLLNALKVTSDGDKIYCPVAYDWNVKTNEVTGVQMFEVRTAVAATDPTGTGINPFTSGFTIGYGNGYN